MKAKTNKNLQNYIKVTSTNNKTTGYANSMYLLKLETYEICNSPRRAGKYRNEEFGIVK